MGELCPQGGSPLFLPLLEPIITKLTLLDFGSDYQSKQNLNANNAAIRTAFDNTLSRDGTSPNQMTANLDMNSNRILNLPAPVDVTEPLRLADLPGISGITFSTQTFISTAALLSAYPLATVLANGTTVVTGCRTTVNDGGGGIFYYVSTDTTTADNGGTIRVDAQGRRWYYAQGQRVYPELFGAKGDGVTNDITAVTNWQNTLAASVAGTGSQTGYLGVNKTYAVNAPVVFNAGIKGDFSSSSGFKALAGFTGVALLDMNTTLGTLGMELENFLLDVRALGTGGTAACIGSSSAFGGGTAAIGSVKDITCLSSSLATHAIKIASSSAEIGALTGRVFNNLVVAAPAPVYIGNNQDDIVLNSTRITITGGATVIPIISGGANQVWNSTYIALSNVAATSTNIIEIAKNPVFNTIFFENTTNSDRLIKIDPIACPIFNGFYSNLTYSGASAHSALFEIDATNNTAATQTQGVILNGYSSSTGLPQFTSLFSLSCAFATNIEPVRLCVSGPGWGLWDSAAANFATFRTGTTVNANNIWQFQGSLRNVFGTWTTSGGAVGVHPTWTPVAQPANWT